MNDQIARHLDSRIQSHLGEAARLQIDLQKHIEATASAQEFEGIEFPDETVLSWYRNFGRNMPQPYVYVAVYIRGTWYVAGDNTNRMNTVTLVEKHLVHAMRETGAVYIVTHWSNLNNWMEEQ